MTSRQELRFRQTFFQNEVKTVLHKMFLVSDVLAHTGRIYSPLNLENIKIQKLKFVLNTVTISCPSYNTHYMGCTDSYINVMRETTYNKRLLMRGGATLGTGDKDLKDLIIFKTRVKQTCE